MRVLIFLGWLTVPLAAYAYHCGPGQNQVQLERAASALQQAEQCAANSQWSEAVAKYDQALASLPAGKTSEARRIRLERAKAQMIARKLPEAHADLKALLAELKDDPDTSLATETRRALASAEYYMTWLMRLEGLPQAVWEPEIEAARQNYRLLAEQAHKTGDS